MTEEALLEVIVEFPHPVAVARRVSPADLHIGLGRLQRHGLVTRRAGLLRLTRRGRSELQLIRALRQTVHRARMFPE